MECQGCGPGLRVWHPVEDYMRAAGLDGGSAGDYWTLEHLCLAHTPEIFLSLQETDYCAIGLSCQKAVYGRGIAEAVVSGDFNLNG